MAFLRIDYLLSMLLISCMAISSSFSSPSHTHQVSDSKDVIFTLTDSSYDKAARKFSLPPFPELSSGAWLDGQVNAELVIDGNGNVLEVLPLVGDTLLVQTAVVSMREWKFSPHVVDGRPVKVRTFVSLDATPFDFEKYSNNAKELVRRLSSNSTISAVDCYNIGFAYHHWIIDRKQAVNWYLKALKLQPDWALALYQLGNAYFRLKDYPNAVSSYRRALEVNPEYFEPAFELIWCYQRHQNHETVVRAIRSASELAVTVAQHRSVHGLAASIYKKQNMKSEVAKELLSELEYTYQFYRTERGGDEFVTEEAYGVAQLFAELGDTLMTKKVYYTAMRYGADTFYGMLSRFALAEQLVKEGAKDEACRLYEEALELRVRAWPDENTEETNRAIELLWLGKAHFGLGNYNDAIASYKKCLQHRPDFNYVYLELGESYRFLGDKPKAVENYRKSKMLSEDQLQQVVNHQ